MNFNEKINKTYRGEDGELEAPGPQATKDDYLPDYSQEVAHLKDEKVDYLAPMPDPSNDAIPSQSGSVQQTPAIPWEKSHTKRSTGRSTGHRGREAKDKNKRHAA